MSETERYERRQTFLARRIAIGKEWHKLHPEGVNISNLADFKVFMRRREKEADDE
jgi:hypothetical protein